MLSRPCTVIIQLIFWRNSCAVIHPLNHSERVEGRQRCMQWSRRNGCRPKILTITRSDKQQRPPGLRRSASTGWRAPHRSEVNVEITAARAQRETRSDKSSRSRSGRCKRCGTPLQPELSDPWCLDGISAAAGMRQGSHEQRRPYRGCCVHGNGAPGAGQLSGGGAAGRGAASDGTARAARICLLIICIVLDLASGPP